MSLVFLRNHLHEYDCAHNHQNIHLANIATMVAMNTLAFVLVETRFLSDYLDLAHFSWIRYSLNIEDATFTNWWMSLWHCCDIVLIVSRLSDLPRHGERLQTAICYLKWFGRLKWLAIGLNASTLFLSTSRRCSRNRSSSRLPFSPTFLTSCNKSVRVMQ